MRHNKKFNHLSRKTGHRKAMLANMANSLIIHKRINTTVAKAKALRMYVEPIITKSKDDSTHSRRTVFGRLQDKNAVSELFRDVAPKIAKRPGGYTRIIKTGPRKGDNAEMCLIELVDYNEVYSKDETKSKRTRRSRRGGSTAKDTGGSNTQEQQTTNKKETASTKKPAESKTETKAKSSSKKEAKDDLTQINGIGPVFAKELANVGFTSFDQFASLTAKDIEKIAVIDGISEDLIESEEWKQQAISLNNFKKLLVNLGTAKASQKDDLKKINGIGEALEKELNDIGVYTFAQISKLLVKDMEYLSALTGVTRNKIESEEWVKHAKDEDKKKASDDSKK